MKPSINLLKNVVLLATIVAFVACSKPELIEPEKPVTKNWPNIWKLTQTTQSGSGIIYNVGIYNGYLYVFANTIHPIRIKWENLYYETDPAKQFHYWVNNSPNGQPIQPYEGTITISVETNNHGNTPPNLEMKVNTNDTSLPWYTSQSFIFNPRYNTSIDPAPWAQPKPSHPMGWPTTYTTQYETHMYNITPLVNE